MFRHGFLVCNSLPLHPLLFCFYIIINSFHIEKLLSAHFYGVMDSQSSWSQGLWCVSLGKVFMTRCHVLKKSQYSFLTWKGLFQSLYQSFYLVWASAVCRASHTASASSNRCFVFICSNDQGF